MQMTAFSQSERFHEAEFPIDWPGDANDEESRLAIGFSKHPYTTDGVSGDYGVRLELFRALPAAKHGWYGLVRFDSQESIEEVLVPSYEDWIALRIALAPLVAQYLTRDYLDEIRTVARRLFRATHGHDPDRACDECDPEEAQRERARQRRWAAERKAAEGTK